MTKSNWRREGLFDLLILNHVPFREAEVVTQAGQELEAGAEAEAMDGRHFLVRFTGLEACSSCFLREPRPGPPAQG